MDDPTGFPLVAQASATQLQADGRPAFARVESRMVLGVHSGRGTVTVNGRDYPVRPGVLLELPWGHAIAYAADPDDPFFVFGLHLIPWHRADAPVELTVPHDRRHHLAGVAWRRDDPAGGRAVVVGTEAQRPELAALVHYAIRLGQHGLPDVARARALGELAVAELARPVRAGGTVPPPLADAIGWALAHLDGPITLAGLARAGRCGTTTINRLFRRHLGQAPMAWVTAQRIDRAAHLLSVTDHTIGRVAREVGLADPFYFSRVFKRQTGLAPSRWRRTRSRP